MSRHHVSFAALATILVALDAPSSAQEHPSLVPSQGPSAGTRLGQPRFKASVDLVSLDVSVRDATGQFLTGLTSEDFLVLEDGRPQHISFVVRSGTLPLRAVLLIDRSSSMHGAKLERAVQAAGLFARWLAPRDQLGIIAFNQQVAQVHAFHTDPARVPSALASVTAMGSTSLYDALLVAANDLVRARADAPSETRDALIVLSDGEDTASLVGFEEVLAVMRRSGALVYTVSFRESAKGEWLGASWPLLALARDTGARALGVPSLDALPALYAEIDAEVRHLYRIGFVSNDARRDGRWRNVAVRVLSRDARVQTRAGYYAAGPRLKGSPP